nr:EOG090X0AJ3 [Cyclestheria hislopi]
MPRRATAVNNLATSAAAAATTTRGPRPPKTPNCIAPSSPSPDSSSDNASDNSDLFSWSTSMDAHLTLSTRSSQSSTTMATSSASLTASRKRKLLEQFLMPENAAAITSNTISLSEMRTLGLVGQPRPSASVHPPVTAPPAVLASTVAVPTRTSNSGSNFASLSTYVPSFSFYQSRSFGPPSCSGGGSTESLCSSTADSACGHAPDLPDDGNLATPGAPMGSHHNRDVHSTDVMEISNNRPAGTRETSPPCTGQGGGTAGLNNSASNRVAGWRLEDIDDNLAADFDGSLSGLGVDLSVASYNMSEALLALPSLTGFKQEAPSPPNGDHGRMGNNPSPPQTVERAASEGRVVASLANHSHPHGSDPGYSHSFQHMLHQHSGWAGVEGTGGPGPITGGVGTGSASSLASSSSNEGIAPSSNNLQPGNPGNNDSYHGEKYKYDRLNETDANADNRFQYVLAAATSIATKVNEESLTYLNQAQPYEIKMKKLGDLSNFRGKLLRSVVRLCFHERRLQYMEREQIAAWRMSRPGDRILEIDVPLSYGVYDVVQDNNNLNVVEFIWDPTKEVGVYIKVNCISTEFTPKKHGGEKGVPFRIQVETYSHGDGDGTPKRLHVAGCQIKVFKLKGADRKHKQDREKIFKRPLSEQEKFQPSCECTILSEIPLELVYTSAIVPVGALQQQHHVLTARQNYISPKALQVKGVPVKVP